MGYQIHAWPYIVRYWPALLIAWGLLKFVDYFRFRNAGENRPLFSGGEVALLILVIFAGSAITTAANVSPEIGNIFEIGNIDLWDITGNNFTYDQHLEQMNVAAGSEIDIDNSFGDVEIHPTDTDRIVVDVRKTIRAADKAEADRIEPDFTFSVRQEGSSYRIRSTRDDGAVHQYPRQRFKSSLAIQVPKRSALHLENRNGRVLIQDLTGDQAIVNRYGDVEVRSINGKVEVENRNGSVTLDNITGSAGVNNRYANVTVKNVGGDLRIDTRNGSVDVSGVKGSASIDNSYAPINVQDVQGELTITGRNNSIEVEHVEGDIRTDNSFQNVSIKDPRGAVTVTGRNGDLFVSFVRAPQKDVSISTRFANVTLELPSSSTFSVDARTEFGEVYSDFDGISTNTARRERSLNGVLGQGGPRLNITTRNGGIRLLKRG
jgi:hypothetical protein